MRLIFLLLALLVIAFVVTRQIGAPPAPQPAAAGTQANQPPAVPTRPQDVQQFSKDMDQFMQDAAARRRKEIDQQTR